MEGFYKTNIKTANADAAIAVSCVDADLYAKRFVDFMVNTVLICDEETPKEALAAPGL